MYKKLTCDETVNKLAEGEALVADVRDLDSYEDGHIQNAVHLSMPMLQEFCDNAEKQQPIIVYCYHGISSQSVAQHLVDQGFSEVYSLIGGYEAWKEHQPTSE